MQEIIDVLDRILGVLKCAANLVGSGVKSEGSDP